MIAFNILSSRLLSLTSVILSLCLVSGCTPKHPTQATQAVAATSPAPSSIALLAKTNLKPICKGGLLKQTATSAEITAYLAKYQPAFPLTCRYMEVPLCPTKIKPLYEGECKP